jgi:hypothetical protein
MGVPACDPRAECLNAARVLPRNGQADLEQYAANAS